MSIDKRREIFGIHAVTARNPDTGEFYGTAKVVGSATADFKGETVELEGGSSPYPWAIENGKISAEINITFKEYPEWLWEAFAGATIDKNAAETTGAISEAAANAYGASVIAGVTGISSVAKKAGAEANLKTGSYTIVAVSPTTVDIYADTDVDFAQGTLKQFVNDDLKINDAPLTIVSSTPTEIPGFGIQLNGGSGAIAMTPGHTARFEVRAANTGSQSVVVGRTSAKYKELELILVGQQKSNKELVKLTVFRAKGIGLPMAFTSREFSTAEITAKAYYDKAKDGIYKLERVDLVS